MLWYLCHETQRDAFSENKSQTNLRQRVEFQTVSLLRPRPPSFRGKQTVAQETFAPLLP
ncbi:unnamed protein product, partial [Arabidopsis halleri]